MTGIKMWFKATVLDFQEKILLNTKCGKWVILGPKINVLKLFTTYSLDFSEETVLEFYEIFL